MTVLEERLSSPEVQTLGDGGTTTALFEEARQRRKRCRLVAVLVVVVFLVVTMMVVLVHKTTTPTTRGHIGHPLINGALVPPMPAQLVVWAATSRNSYIEVISSTTGNVVRRLATDVGVIRGTTQPTVSPFGIVYFDDAYFVNHTPDEQIKSVPLAGGPVSVLADGYDPAVSPNGHSLAYLTWTDLTNAPEAIVVRNLLTGATSTWQYSTNGPEINQISWSPDSKSLLFSTNIANEATRLWTLGTWVLDLSSPNRSLDSVRPIPLPAGMFLAGYINATEGIGYFRHVGFRSQPKDDWFEPTVVDVATGRIVERLPTVPGLLASSVATSGGGGLQVDPSGRHLALVEEGSGHNVGFLYRWTINSVPARILVRPILVKSGVGSAAWVPVH
jgi:hypothetical protein